MLVYPPDGHVTTSETIFFIGSAKGYCKINGQNIEIFDNGNFSPVVDLNLGENHFLIEIDGEAFRREIICNSPDPANASLSPQPWREAQDLKYSYDQGFKRLCLDPGHGGSQRGTCSPKGIAEKDLNLKLAKLIKEKFFDSDIQVVLTRDTDSDLALAERVAIAEKTDSDLFISVHHNAIPDDQKPLEHKGISVHYYYEHSKSFAEKLAQKISNLAGLDNRGAIRQDLHVLRENPQRISVLVEFGFLIHPTESQFICSELFQDTAAKAVFESISRERDIFAASRSSTKIH